MSAVTTGMGTFVKTVTGSVTKTPWDGAAALGRMRGRRRSEREEWSRGRRIGRYGTGLALLITRRSQVQILPPLPTCQRYNRRSTARKFSLRAVFMSGEGVGRNQIRDQESSQVSRCVSGRWWRIETNGPDWDGIGPARRRPPGRKPSGRTRDLARLARMAASSCFRRLRSTPVAPTDPFSVTKFGGPRTVAGHRVPVREPPAS